MLTEDEYGCLAHKRLEPTHVVDRRRLWIRCLVCGMTSHNVNDIEHLYCSNCHQFHPIRPASTPAENASHENASTPQPAE